MAVMTPRSTRLDATGDSPGFTLIELLVVMVVLAILATIAIPTFLSQRRNGYKATAKTDLRNAATAVESVAAGKRGDYTQVFTTNVAGTALLTAAPSAQFKASTNVTVTLGKVATTTDFCVVGVNSSAPTSYFVFSKSKKGLQAVEYATVAAAKAVC